MSLRRDLGEAVVAVRRRPALLTVGFVAALFQTGAWVAGNALVDLVVPFAARFGGPLVGLVFITATYPLFVGIYVPVLEPPDGTLATLARAAHAVRRTYRHVLVADVVSLVVALLAALGALVTWFVVSTVFRYGRYALTDVGSPPAFESFFIGMGSVLLGLALGRLFTGFADVFVVFDGERPRHAWRWSLRFAATRPVSLLGFGVAVVALQAGPGVVADQVTGFAGDGPGVAILGWVLIVALASVGTTLTATLHAVYFDRTVGPAVAATQPVRLPDGIRWTTVAVAGLLVTSAVVGAAAVRTADLPRYDSPTRPLPEDPQEAYAVAASNTAESNFRHAVDRKNMSDPNATFVPARRSAVDYRDRQLYVSYYGNEPSQSDRGFVGEGAVARSRPFGDWPGLPIRSVGDWSVLQMPGWGLVHSGSTTHGDEVVPNPGVNWTVVEQNESVLVLRVDDPEAIRTALDSAFPGMGDNMTDDSYLEVNVDRERGVVNGADFRVSSRDTGKNFSYRMRLEEVGTADIERPVEIGPRTPLEWFWDVVYY